MLNFISNHRAKMRKDGERGDVAAVVDPNGVASPSQGVVSNESAGAGRIESLDVISVSPTAGVDFGAREAADADEQGTTLRAETSATIGASVPVQSVLLVLPQVKKKRKVVPANFAKHKASKDLKELDGYDTWSAEVKAEKRTELEAKLVQEIKV
jgi:hypothetical protein